MPRQTQIWYLRRFETETWDTLINFFLKSKIIVCFYKINQNKIAQYRKLDFPNSQTTKQKRTGLWCDPVESNWQIFSKSIFRNICVLWDNLILELIFSRSRSKFSCRSWVRSPYRNIFRTWLRVFSESVLIPRLGKRLFQYWYWLGIKYEEKRGKD